MEKIKSRFLTKVEKTESGCWMWKGSTRKPVREGMSVYGTFSYKSKPVYAHRMSYELFVGEVPAGLKVLHKCDVQLCVNPAHLFLGTQMDNVQDMIAKGRNKNKGDTHYRSMLTEEKVAVIRERLVEGETVKVLSTEYGVSASAIRDVKLGRRWRLP